MAIDATSRLWMAGVVSTRRDRELADQLLQQVRACCPSRRALLVCTDGWEVYPESIMHAFRDKVKKLQQGKSLFRGVAGAVYRHRDQTHPEETGGGGHAQGDLGNA